MTISRSLLLRIRNISDKIVEKIKQIFHIQQFFSEELLRDNVEKYCKAGQNTDDNIAHAQCMLDD